MRPWRSHGNESDATEVRLVDGSRLQCGRGGATEMSRGLVALELRIQEASMRPWRSHGNEKVVTTTDTTAETLQCGRGGATEMR